MPDSPLIVAVMGTPFSLPFLLHLLLSDSVYTTAAAVQKFYRTRKSSRFVSLRHGVVTAAVPNKKKSKQSLVTRWGGFTTMRREFYGTWPAGR